MAGKIKDTTTEVIAVIYGLTTVAARIWEMVERQFPELFGTHGEAASVIGTVVPSGQSADL